MNKKVLTYLLIGIALADLLAAVDSNAVTIALPKIAQDFGIGLSAVALVTVAYTAGLVASLIPVGHLGDHFGHKKAFLLGLLGFGASSAAIIASHNLTTMLVFRLIQGVCAGVLYTASGALVAKHWKNTEMAFGVTAAFLSIGMLIGPLIGGFLADLNVGGFAGWHWIFAVNVPIVLASYILVLFTAKETETHPAPSKADWHGLLSNRTFLAIAAFTALCMFCLPALSFISSFYLQDVLHLSGTEAGLRLIPIPITMAIFSVVSGGLPNWRLGSIIGGSLITLGLLWLHFVTPASSYAGGLLVGYVLVSAGAGFMFTNTFAAALGSTNPKLSGLVAGSINTFQQAGSLLGVAFVSSFAVVELYQALYLYLMIAAALSVVAAVFVTQNRYEH